MNLSCAFLTHQIPQVSKLLRFFRIPLTYKALFTAYVCNTEL